MEFHVLALFAGPFDGFLRASVLGRAVARGDVRVRLWELREFAEGKHRSTDDSPYGGGSGMVMLADPIVRGVEAVRAAAPSARAVLLSPQGRPFAQADAERLASHPAVLLVCGRYEGFDERVRAFADEELSVGDFVVAGGEVPAMAVIDAVSRLVPGVLGSADSTREESFADGLLEYPQYTRPVEFRGMRVPEILLGGNHERIRAWRRKQALLRTRSRRPDLFARIVLTDADRRLLDEDDES